MAKFRDWPKTLRSASYRGVAFFVDTDDIETGRRLEIHEFPHSDQPYVEDLGRSATMISVTAYVVSDTADRDAASLMKACGAGGAALLSLPMERLQAHCQSCRRSFAKDRLGFVAFQIEFVREGTGAGPFPIGFLSSLVASAVSALRAPAAAAFEQAYGALVVPGWVADSALHDVRSFAGLAAGLLSESPMQSAKAPALSLAAATLYATAPSLTRAGVTQHAGSARSFAATSQTVPSTPLANALFDLSHGIAAATAGDGLATIAPLLAFGSDAQPQAASGWKRVAVENTAAISRVVRQAALAGYAERVSATRYDDRRGAIQARADVAELFDFEMQTLTPGRDHAVARAMTDISGRTAEYLSRQIADLAPILIVEAPRRMPSLWWSQRLYGTQARAGELVARNGVKHPSFMPATFEAKSR